MTIKYTIFTLAVILLISLNLACSKKEPKSVKQRRAIEMEIKSKAPIKITLSKNESLATAVKNQGLFPEFNISNYQYLNQNELYTKIDGAADGYIKNHGFKGCGYLEISHKLDKTPMTIYVYDMDKGIQGFGIYSSERQSDYNYIKMGTEGYIGKSGLTFWKGKYYIKIELQGEPESPETGKKLLMTIGKRLADIIPDEPNLLQKFDLFPKESRIRYGEQYYKANFQSVEGFNNVYEVKYRSKNGKTPATLFIAHLKSEKEIKAVLDKYKELLGFKKYNISGNRYSATDPIEKRKLLFQIKGKQLLGATGFESEAKQKEMLDKLIKLFKNEK